MVVCAHWSVTALTTAALLDRAAATFHANRVVDANQAARDCGVVPGLRRRESQRRAPDLIIHQRDPAAEGRAFEVVLRSLDDITPRVEVESPGWASFASRGPSRYFGGDQSMNERVLGVVQTVLDELIPSSSNGLASTVGVGTADTRFAALQAARLGVAHEPVVVPSGESAAFLAPLPVSTLGVDDLAEILQRMGLGSLGGFAALAPSDVLARFGAAGANAHRCARGVERRAANLQEPPADFSSVMSLDPPLDRVDQVAFVARTLALEFCGRLGALGLSCAQVAIVAHTEHGEELTRLWRGEGALTAGAIADRARWQLDGWLNGPARLRPSSGVSRIELRPVEVIAADGRQLGFWGEQTEQAERAARAVARVQGILGTGQVSVLEAAGGRSFDQQVIRVPVEAVDLVSRAEGSGPNPSPLTYESQLPPPAPAVVFPDGRSARVLDVDGHAVHVAGRGLLSCAPETVVVSGRVRQVQAWAGPWLLDERWWDADRRRRRARLQVVCADGQALLLACVSQEWFLEAVYG